MVFKNLAIPKLCIFLLISVLPLLPIAHSHVTPIVPPETICLATTNPSYCKNVLANQNGTIFDYARISAQKAMSQSLRFLNLVNFYLRDRSSLSQPTIRALEDCQFFARRSFDDLSKTRDTIDKPSELFVSEIEDVHIMLSSVFADQQTCLDGLETTASDERVKNVLSSSLSNNTKLYSVSLDLFVKGWVGKNKVKTTWQHNQRQLRMSKQLRVIYDYDNKKAMISNKVIVCQDGSGNFTTINEAISAAPNNTSPKNGYFLIHIKAGIYEEYVHVPETKKYLMMVGDGINRTIITGDHCVPDGFTIFSSGTLVVKAEGFVAVGITICNAAGPAKYQAVALANTARQSTFYKCSMEGYQDTLYANGQQQFYRECDIYGTIDFIFGFSTSVFQNCNIYVRLPKSGQYNVIAAHGATVENVKIGISIHNATIKAADDLAPMVGKVKTYLGRPWKPYTTTVYLQSFMDNLIDPEGWIDSVNNISTKGYYFAEYNNRGPGSDTKNRKSWPNYHIINATDAAKFTVSNFIDGDSWLPYTGIPYCGGLI